MNTEIPYWKTEECRIIKGIFQEVARKRFYPGTGQWHPAFWNDSGENDWLAKADILTHPLYFGKTNYEEVKQGLKDILRQMDEKIAAYTKPPSIYINLSQTWPWDHPE